MTNGVLDPVMYNERNTSPCSFSEVRLLLENITVHNKMPTYVPYTVYVIKVLRREPGIVMGAL